MNHFWSSILFYIIKKIFYDTYDNVDDLNDILAEKTAKLQTTIQEQTQEIQQLKKENEKLKQSNINFDKFKYNAVTIYDEKQIKNTGIEKIHEEILSIEDKLFFITTLVYNDGSIFEEIIYFDNNEKNEIEVWKQAKRYQNIEEYKKNTCLIDKKNQFLNKITVKDFLKQQQDFKLKPTKAERTLWCIFTAIAVLAGISTFIGVIILFFPTVAVIPAVALGLKLVGTLSSISFIRIFASLFSSATRKVDVWFSNKFYKNKEQKEKEKKERQSIIKNLSVDKLETKLQTQYDILKQELDNRKDIKSDKLINNKTVNNNSNNISENLDIKSENNIIRNLWISSVIGIIFILIYSHFSFSNTIFEIKILIWLPISILFMLLANIRTEVLIKDFKSTKYVEEL